MNYVCGFAYAKMSERVMKVLLIKKNRPAWQAGSWNGVGGKIELGEGVRQAMAREFQEETGLVTHGADWSTFHIERFRSGAKVYFMHNWTLDIEALAQAETDSMAGKLTDEDVYSFQVDPVTGHPMLAPGFPLMYNLWYLIPMSVATHRLPVEHQPLGG